MSENLHIKFRKGKNGAEESLIQDFLGYCDELFGEEGLKYTILTELYAEVGIPDILIIAWDYRLEDSWSPRRNELTKKDIKILHHISASGKKGIKQKRLCDQLGYEDNTVKSSLEKLVDANLVAFEKHTARILNIEDIFFVRKIISVEAKIKNWKSAFEQALLNENFASHSYVLLPNERINEKILDYREGNVGLLAHHGEGAVFKRKARKSKLPGSYFSWIINEYIGRQFYSAAQVH